MLNLAEYRRRPALLSDWLPGTTGSIVYVDGGSSHNTWFPEEGDFGSPAQ